MGFFVYVIYNEERSKIYIGQTADLEKRLKRHNGELKNKNSSFTKRNEGEWIVIHTEEYNTREEVIKREKELKSARGREFAWGIIEKI